MLLSRGSCPVRHFPWVHDGHQDRCLSADHLKAANGYPILSGTAVILALSFQWLEAFSASLCSCSVHSLLLVQYEHNNVANITDTICSKFLKTRACQSSWAKGMPGCPRDHQSVHVRLSANLIGYETGSLSDVGHQTVLDDENYRFVHAVSGACDDPGNGSSLGDYTRGTALDHSRWWVVAAPLISHLSSASYTVHALAIYRPTHMSGG